tara:strand:+ start:340 stop:825 length:486 start_codon:yes stop_codon:yes gene_type:complete
MIKIYKLTSPNTDKCYIGSTKQRWLSDRVSSHRVQQRRYESGKDKLYCSSFEIIKCGDMEYELIEETNDKSRECYWIEQNNCVNIHSLKFGKKGDPVKKAEYTKNNKAKRAEYLKQYREKHKTPIPCKFCSKEIKSYNMTTHLKKCKTGKNFIYSIVNEYC